ncbi:MAG: single-stranded-DNA-specific exonuclease RecJ [Phycisphaerae bacterium]|nr:single-stranded-DNA-specific exonuclease RecJ [Phycisphaerae bacterium]
MRGMTHRWRMPEEPPGSSWTPGAGLEPLVARLLWHRGFRDDAALLAFQDVRMTGLHDPGLLRDCDRAAERLLRAAVERECIVIYGDYDVDGVSASAILFHVLRAVAPACDVRTYVPHRLDEGYGLHVEAIRQLAADGARVVVSVDCGVTAFEPAMAAREAGIDLIITDHHTISGARLPDAYALIHPRDPRGSYPFGDLCGAGVAFKLAWRIATLAEGAARLRDSTRAVLLDAMALAALGTIADIVPLVGENRIIARHGLRRIKSTSLVGLQALIEASDLAGENVTAEKVGFILGPRLNACGRMGHARDAVEMLTVAGPARAAEIARSLTRLNEERRKTERVIFEEACEAAERAGMTGDDRRAIVLAGESWHAGVVGIVCSRLVERFQRPTILLQRQDGHLHGSGRSIDGFNLHDGLAACAGMLTKFGGHEMAAGLALEASQLGAFAEAFTAHANDRIGVDQLTPALRIDCEARLDEITPAAAGQIEDIGPFGRGNPTASVVVRNVEIPRSPESMGARGDHLRFFIRDGRREMRVVAFGWGERGRELRGGMRVDVVIEPKINRWNGSERVEAELRDLRAV